MLTFVKFLGFVLAATVSLGCGDDGGGGNDPDAGAEPDAEVRPAHVVFLNFEGVALTMGMDDSAANSSQIISDPVTMTAFLDDQADRDTRIANVVASVELAFEPFNVDVVTERPSSGDYDMVVLSGAADEIGLPSGVGAIAGSDCANTQTANIAFVFGDTFLTLGEEPAATLTIGAVGLQNGIPSSAQIGDCMCFSQPGCPDANRCVVSGANTPIVTSDPCAGGRTTMDVQGRFGTTFGLRL